MTQQFHSQVYPQGKWVLVSPQRHGQECSQQSYNSQKLGTVQMSITRRMYKQLQCAHTLVYYEQ